MRNDILTQTFTIESSTWVMHQESGSILALLELKCGDQYLQQAIRADELSKVHRYIGQRVKVEWRDGKPSCTYLNDFDSRSTSTPLITFPINCPFCKITLKNGHQCTSHICPGKTKTPLYRFLQVATGTTYEHIDLFALYTESMPLSSTKASISDLYGYVVQFNTLGNVNTAPRHYKLVKEFGPLGDKIWEIEKAVQTKLKEGIVPAEFWYVTAISAGNPQTLTTLGFGAVNPKDLLERRSYAGFVSYMEDNFINPFPRKIILNNVDAWKLMAAVVQIKKV